ncbi:MAG: hypothetical protein QXP98_09480 [Thermoproteus sp.]
MKLKVVFPVPPLEPDVMHISTYTRCVKSYVAFLPPKSCGELVGTSIPIWRLIPRRIHRNII